MQDHEAEYRVCMGLESGRAIWGAHSFVGLWGLKD